MWLGFQIVVALGTALPMVAAQQTIPTQTPKETRACGGGRTVDDYLEDIAKSQKKRRNKNPLPDSVCVFGWCKSGTSNPGPFPNPPSVESKQKVETEPADQHPPTPPPGTSSSKRPVEEVAMPPKLNDSDQVCDPMRAAKDVEVGDFYYSDKSYKAALNRYKLGLENWPDEPAIHFRLARTYEAMRDPGHAAEHYQFVVDIAPNSPLAKEASAALSRLRK